MILFKLMCITYNVQVTCPVETICILAFLWYDIFYELSVADCVSDEAVLFLLSLFPIWFHHHTSIGEFTKFNQIIIGVI